jgi:signal transduction histidine kinase
MEWRAGDVMGLLPYSRVAGPPGDSVAQEPSEILTLPGDQLRELTRQCHEITAILVHAMIDRAKAFTSSDLHDEKMVSLGKLSAGLAHELNNPVSAIERSAALLDDRLNASEAAAWALGVLPLTEAQLAAVDSVRKVCLARQGAGVRSPIQQAEREEAMSDWLEAHGVDIDLAETLADTAVTFEALDTLAQSVAVLRWGACGCSVRSLASEIQEAAMRISGLVTAIKGFTHMDQAPVAGPVDLVLGLSHTVTVLRAKARAKSATVVVEVEPGLPHARGFAGELNQIWANLIDNALDAIHAAGRVDVTAKRDGRQAVVCVTDNGQGIPAEIRESDFRPVLHHKANGFRYRPWPRHRAAPRSPQRRRDLGGLATGPDPVPRCPFAG